jgi:Terminase large subunit, T4likevirus-type, N-terminal
MADVADKPVSLGKDFARALDPVILAKDCGINPDPVQAKILSSSSNRLLLNCSRQWGKSTTAALIALHTALYDAPAMIVLISPSQPQSTELFKKIHGFWAKLSGAPKADQETLTRMQLANGSRIVSLPGSEKTTRGYSAAKIVIMDEASRVPDELLAVVRPMLATTRGRFMAMSTPAGKRGWFYEAWEHGEGWEKVRVEAKECPRISPEFLKEEMSALGPMQYSQEYECQFIDPETAVFNSELIEAALVDDFEPFLRAA